MNSCTNSPEDGPVGPKHVEIQQYTNKIVTSVGFHSIYTYLLTATGLTPGGSSTVHIYTQTIHRTTQLTALVGRLSGIRTKIGQTKTNDELTT